MSRAVDTGTNQLLRTVADHVATVSFNRPQWRHAPGCSVTGVAAPMAAAEPPA